MLVPLFLQRACGEAAEEESSQFSDQIILSERPSYWLRGDGNQASKQDEETIGQLLRPLGKPSIFSHQLEGYFVEHSDSPTGLIARCFSTSLGPTASEPLIDEVTTQRIVQTPKTRRISPPPASTRLPKDPRDLMLLAS